MGYGMPQFPGQTRRDSWWSRNWPLLVPMGGCISTLCACLLLIGGLFGSWAWTLRSSDPVNTAVRAVEANTRAKGLLGEPLSTGWLITGNLNLNGADGSVNATVPVSGPTGSGKVTVIGTRRNSAWTYTSITLVMDNGTDRVTLSTTPR